MLFRSVTLEQLEDYLGEARALWTLSDFSELKALQSQLARGDLAVAKVFPPIAPASPTTATTAKPAEPAGLDGLAGDDPKANRPEDGGFKKPAEAAAPRKAPPKKVPTTSAPAAPAVPSPAAPTTTVPAEDTSGA